MEMRPFFQGRWHLSRTILNLKSKKIMMESISGTCLFNETITSEEEELLYTEELMMTQCETSSTMLIPASRQYLYSFPTNCDSFDMYFYKNEKPQAHFQRLKKQKEEEESMHHFSGLHDCFPDQYTTHLWIQSLTSFRIEIQVNGPEKHHLITSKYTRG